MSDAQEAAGYITRSPGGLGAVREVCDCLLERELRLGTK